MNFQYMMMSFFGIMAVIGVAVFAIPKKPDAALGEAKGTVVVWGTFTNGGIGRVFQSLNDKYKDTFSVKYEYHDPKNFDGDIVEALASGRGPDILLLPDDLILRHLDKIDEIPYTTLPQAVFKSTFIQASEIYMREKGIIAIPYAIDPMVMYWNRDIFNNASISVPPKFWDELLVLSPKLTIRDQKTQTITQSAIAFGEYANVGNAKNILAMLFLQTGDPIVKIENWKPFVDLSETVGELLMPKQTIINAFRFYMDFSNPLKSIYTWNRSLPNSRDEFVSGNLAVYFDYASSYETLKAKNPHLNIGVALVPQIRDTKVEVTSARMHGLAVLKSSTNKRTAFVAVQKLLESEYSGEFASAYDLPPVRRDLLNSPQTDAVMAVFYDSAIRARTWLDPRPETSDRAFQDAIETVSSGRSDVGESVSVLIRNISSALAPYQ